MRIGLITLGCDKNTVDTEYLAGVLEACGHEVVAEGEQAHLDVAVLFTCGFIEAAREETLQAIGELAAAKEKLGNPRRLVVAGCHAPRIENEPCHETAGVDAFAGVGRPGALADLVEAVGGSDGEATPGNASAWRVSGSAASPSMRLEHPLPRKRLDSAPFAYLKIADGCDHACAFCAIPAMKGPYASVPREFLLDEARALLDSGARELNLIGQDLAPYGRDLYDDYVLPDLLEDLCRLDGDFWVRLLYFYPAGLTERFLEVFAGEAKILKYLDLPLQHLDPGVLKAMRRPDAGVGAAERIAALRTAVPGIVVRTTMLVGFPGESSQAFKTLLKGVREIRFERLGVFAFSREEGTPASTMAGPVAARTAERRLDRLMLTQAEISAELQREQIGRRLRVLVESVAPGGRELRGRSYREAPEVDGEIIIAAAQDAPPDSLRGIRPGDFVDVRVVRADVYDLYGSLASVERTDRESDFDHP